MKNVMTIFKKEMRRFFTDKRMLLALFMPGLLILVLYSVLGRFMASAVMEVKVENASYRIAYTDNSGATDKPLLIESYDQYLASNEKEKTNKAEYYPVPVSEIDATKEALKLGKYDVFIVFSDNFEVAIEEDTTSPLNNYIQIFYNGEKAIGTTAYSSIKNLVDICYKKYVINMDSSGNPIEPNLGKSDYMGSKIMSFIMPMLTLSMLFSTVMSICPDAIAGEKERGTLSSLLITPIKRSELALGKILALTLTAALSGIVSFLGIMGGLPSMLSGLNIALDVGTIFALALLIITTLILFVSIGTLVSTVSKTVKECSSYMTPLLVLLMASAFLPLVINSNGLGFAFVPLLNVSICMSSLVGSTGINAAFIVITGAMNLVISGALLALISSLFHKERIIVS